MNKFTINHARREVITLLNRYGDEFPELKNEVFYYNKGIGCFTTREAVWK